MRHKRSLSLLIAVMLLLSTAVPAAMGADLSACTEEPTAVYDLGDLLEPADTPASSELSTADPDGDGKGEGEEPGEPGEGEGEEEPEPVHEISPIGLRRSNHEAYMNGVGGALFTPDAAITRAQAAQILYNLLESRCDITTDFTDVRSDAWYYSAVNTLASLGVIKGYGGYFDPNRAVTRAEYAAMLSRFGELASDETIEFSDMDSSHWGYKYVITAYSKGWLTSLEEGKIHPNEVVTRAHAAAITNRALGRTPDKAVIDANPDMRIFVDNHKEHWAYYDIMEASVSHKEQIGYNGETWQSFEKIGFDGGEGFFFTGGYLYYYSAREEDFVKNTRVGSFDFNSEGHYTTGNDELDTFLHEITSEIISTGQTREEMLRTVYLYVRDGFTYLRRNYYAVGATGWEMDEALTMFRTRHGNCYCYAAAFYYLTRWVGYDSVIFAGKVGSNNSDHGWVEIPIDGVVYGFDAELEMARIRDGRPFIDYYKFTLDKAPIKYIKATSDLAAYSQQTVFCGDSHF